MDEITAIFADLGFAVAEGPQIESDWYNFDALNIPAEHPARQDHDTFYMARAGGDNRPPHVLRTHTSPVQIRALEGRGVPIRVIAPGRVYRADYDQTHTPTAAVVAVVPPAVAGAARRTWVAAHPRSPRRSRLPTTISRSE